MNKYAIVSTFFLGLTLMILGCSTALYVAPETHPYNEGLNFTVERVQQLTPIEAGGYHFSVDKGFRVLEVTVTVANTSTDTQTIDFENFYLLDPKTQMRYKTQLTLGEGMMGTYGRLAPTINKGGVKHRKLLFAFPKDEKPELLEVKGITYNLRYTAAPPAEANNATDEN